MRTLASFAAAAVLVATASAHAATYTYTTIDNPADPTFNQLLGINNAGAIAGYYGSGVAGHPNKGYTIAPPYTKFLPDNYPGSVQTQATAIIPGQATPGFWSSTNTGMDANYGFIRFLNGKSYTYINVNDPLVASTPPVTQVLGMNSSQVAVGFYNDAGGNPHGFSYSVSKNTYTPVNIGAATAVGATGINSFGMISGFYTNPNGRTLGFLKLPNSAGALSFAVPGSANTQFLGVNDAATAVGFYEDKNMIDHGVIYNKLTGEWTQIDAPGGVQGTVLNGLNNKNQIVGFYTDAAGNVHGLLVDVSK
jgi:hypothetical protein